MGMGPIHDRFDRSPAKPDIAFGSVDAALPRAKPAVLEHGVGFFNSSSKLSLPVKFLVGRFPRFSFSCRSIKSSRGYKKRSAQ
jgi:hypothetical protein